MQAWWATAVLPTCVLGMQRVVTVQAEPDDEDEAEDSDGEDFLLKGPRSDLELRYAVMLQPSCTTVTPARSR